jgi:hypothetical protein
VGKVGRLLFQDVFVAPKNGFMGVHHPDEKER